MLDDVVDNVHTETKVNRDEVFEATTIELGAPTKANNDEEEHPDAVPTEFEEESQFLEYWLEIPCFDGAYTKFAIADDRNEESINDEDDIEWEATMDTSEEVHGILMHWNPEEIRFYYNLMLQNSIGQGIDDCGQA